MDLSSLNTYISFNDDDDEDLQVLLQTSNSGEVNSAEVIWECQNDIELSLFDDQVDNSSISVDHSSAWEEDVQLHPFTQEPSNIAEYDGFLYNSDVATTERFDNSSSPINSHIQDGLHTPLYNRKLASSNIIVLEDTDSTQFEENVLVVYSGTQEGSHASPDIVVSHNITETDLHNSDDATTSPSLV